VFPGDRCLNLPRIQPGLRARGPADRRSCRTLVGTPGNASVHGFVRSRIDRNFRL